MIYNFKDNVDVVKVDNMRGGTGSCTLYKQKDLPPHYKMIAEIHIHPSSCIGEHSHHGDYETVYCVSGRGIVIDDGNESILLPGMVNMCLDGHSHSIINQEVEDLVIIGIVKES